MFDTSYAIAIPALSFIAGYLLCCFVPYKHPYERDNLKTKNVGHKAGASAERQTPPVSLQDILDALENPGLTAAVEKRIEEVRAECKKQPENVIVSFSDLKICDLFFVLERKSWTDSAREVCTDAFEYIENAREHIRTRSDGRMTHRIEVIRAARLPDGRYIGYEPMLRVIKLERIP